MIIPLRVEKDKDEKWAFWWRRGGLGMVFVGNAKKMGKILIFFNFFTFFTLFMFALLSFVV
jgi:hypothetical protein